MHFLPLIALALLSPGGAQADTGTPLVEPTMLSVDDALPTGSGLAEIEATYLFATSKRSFDRNGGIRQRGENRLHLGTLTATHGIGPDVDIAAAFEAAGFVDADDPARKTRAAGDLLLNLKWRFRGEGDSGLHLALVPSLGIPTGDPDGALAPGLGLWTLGQKLVATYIAGRWVVGADAKLALAFGDDRNPTRGLVLAGAGLGYQLTTWLKPSLELDYERNILVSKSDAELLALTAGAVFNATDRLRLDVGLRHGLLGRSMDRVLGVSANLSWTFF